MAEDFADDRRDPEERKDHARKNEDQHRKLAQEQSVPLVQQSQF